MLLACLLAAACLFLSLLHVVYLAVEGATTFNSAITVTYPSISPFQQQVEQYFWLEFKGLMVGALHGQQTIPVS